MRLLPSVLAASALAGVRGAISQSAPLDQLRWLGGCWELRRGPRTTMEMWMPPEGGLMLGASRTAVNGVVRESEQLRLSLRGDTLVYTALPSGQKETEFKTVVVSDSGFAVAPPSSARSLRPLEIAGCHPEAMLPQGDP